MTSLVTPWTLDRQVRAHEILACVGADICAPERFLAWNDVDEVNADGTCVVYWMARAQRGTHNLALDCSIAAARHLDLPLVVVFRRFAGPVGTQIRHVEWMLRGLPEALTACACRGAHVFVVDQDGPDLVELFSREQLHPAIVVVDDDVMPRARRGRARVAAQVAVPVISVDADVVVPGACFPKQEYAARTLRPKLHRVLANFDHELGNGAGGSRAPALPLVREPSSVDGVWRFDPAAAFLLPGPPLDDWLRAAGRAGTPSLAGPLPDEPSGSRAAHARLRAFVEHELTGYALRRNKPEHDATSRISRFIRFGQISPHEVLAAVRSADAPEADIATFVEEFVVRRELAYNFVRWNPDAASIDGITDWAKRTLIKHASDEREWLWDEDTLAAADTHDPLWNAAQRQLVETGHMHGYIRMYWAKKILEWTPSPRVAFDIALRFNDRWHLDGRDPNGIVGVAWAIGGVHDRPWGERPIFGQIRFMSLNSTGRKFDSKRYIARWGGERGAARRNDAPGALF